MSPEDITELENRVSQTESTFIPKVEAVRDQCNMNGRRIHELQAEIDSLKADVAALLAEVRAGRG